MAKVPNVAGARVLLVEARFYEDIADALVKGATAALDEAGVPYDRVAVPGALEIPAAIAMMLTGKGEAAAPAYDGVVALGCVIRGETSHYDYVCLESASGLQQLAIKYAYPIANGILTCENGDQAWARADPARKDKGGAVARACLDMIALKRHFAGQGD